MATTTLKSRMPNPVFVTPGALEALHAVAATTADQGIEPELFELMNLRVSQINGCSVCVDLHARGLKRMGESDDRIVAVGAWRHSPYFSEAERAALALAESLTRLADRPDPVPDEVWDEAARHYDAHELSALVLSIAQINLWNRLNVAVGQLVGDWKAEGERAAEPARDCGLKAATL
jgi:AhpD family alkylhydroperoxidase